MFTNGTDDLHKAISIHQTRAHITTWIVSGSCRRARTHTFALSPCCTSALPRQRKGDTSEILEKGPTRATLTMFII